MTKLSKDFRVTVYCGATPDCDPKYIKMAYDFGYEMGQQGWGLVFGAGSKGLMGAVSEGCFKGGGKVEGISFRSEVLSLREPPNFEVTLVCEENDIHDRKKTLHSRGSVIVVLPGGVGTLDELMEALTWKKLKLLNKEIVIYNYHGFWDHLIKMMEHLVEEKFFAESDWQQVKVVSDQEALVRTLKDLV